jgi:hypothetical protein
VNMRGAGGSFRVAPGRIRVVERRIQTKQEGEELRFVLLRRQGIYDLGRLTDGIHS